MPTFNFNLKAISEHIANHLKFDGPIAVLAICELKEPTITFPDDLEDSSNLKTVEEVQPCPQPAEVVEQKHPEDVQPCDATFHAQDEDQTSHNGLVGKNELHPR